jgi:hypothetical protein
MSMNYSAARPLIRGGGSRDEPMTASQSARLREVTEQLGEPFDSALTRQQAAARLRELESKLR